MKFGQVVAAEQECSAVITAHSLPEVLAVIMLQERSVFALVGNTLSVLEDLGLVLNHIPVWQVWDVEVLLMVVI